MADPVLSPSEIQTPRLRLRRLRLSDAALLRLYVSDARVARMTATIPHPYPPGQAETFIERSLSPSAKETVWALDAGTESENGLIGTVSLKPHATGETEVGYWVAPAFWGTGYATEAVEAMIGFCAARGDKVLVAQVFQDNVASAKVLTRCGFAYIGEGEGHSVARGGYVPNFRYRRELGGAVP